MTCDVILTTKNGKYVARAREWPDVVVEEDYRDAVIHRIKTKLQDYLTKQVEVIKIEVPMPNETGNLVSTFCHPQGILVVTTKNVLS